MFKCDIDWNALEIQCLNRFLIKFIQAKQLKIK